MSEHLFSSTFPGQAQPSMDLHQLCPPCTHTPQHSKMKTETLGSILLSLKIFLLRSGQDGGVGGHALTSSHDIKITTKF